MNEWRAEPCSGLVFITEWAMWSVHITWLEFELRTSWSTLVCMIELLRTRIYSKVNIHQWGCWARQNPRLDTNFCAERVYFSFHIIVESPWSLRPSPESWRPPTQISDIHRWLRTKVTHRLLRTSCWKSGLTQRKLVILQKRLQLRQGCPWSD